MRPSRALLALLTAVVGYATSASASLLSYDDPTFGPNSAVLDTTTGIEWLKLSLSTNLTPSNVISDLAPGGQFAGFSVASILQFTDLTANYFGSGICCNMPLDPDTTSAFSELFGPTATDPTGFPTVDGYFGYVPGLAPSIVFGDFYYQPAAGNSGPIAGFFDESSTTDLSDLSPDPTRGTYLIRNTPAIPEPATLSLLAVGLGLLGWTRRQHRP